MTSRLEFGPGDGVVAAFDDVAALIADDGPREELLELLRESAAADTSGEDLARRLARVLTGDGADELPSFGVLAPVGGDLLVFLHGGVGATCTAAGGGQTRLSGRDAATWTDRRLGPEIERVLLVPEDGAAGDTDSPFELQGGVVPGGWLRLQRAGEPAETDDSGEPAPPTDGDVAPDETAEPAEPADHDEAPGAAAPPEPEAAAAPPGPEAPAEPAAPAAPPGPDAEDDAEEDAEEDAEPEPATEPHPTTPPPPPPATADEDADEAVDEAVDEDDEDADEGAGGAAVGTEAEADPATEPRSTEFESVELTPDRETLRRPLPVETEEPDEAGDGEPEGEMIQGILCSRQHFNNPQAQYCSSCGISMVHQTHNLVERERPPLGILVFDDGSTFTLDDQYVLGREPQSDDLVEQDEARPVELEDPGRSISRSHAEIRLVDWDVQLVDRGSTNGTHVWNEAEEHWEQLDPGEPRTITPGDRVAVGQRTFVYESPHGG